MFPKAARVGANLPAGRVYLRFFRIALHADGLSRVFDRDGTGIGIKADRRKRVYPDASAFGRLKRIQRKRPKSGLLFPKHFTHGGVFALNMVTAIGSAAFGDLAEIW
jgi:hypothetical protein